MRPQIWCLALATTACSTEPPPARPPPDAQVASALSLDPPVQWVRDIRAVEAHAGQIGGRNAKALCADLRAGDAATVATHLTQDFRGRGWQVDGSLGHRDEGVERRVHPVARPTLDRAAFAEMLVRRRSRFTTVDRCALGVFGIKIAEPRRNQSWARLAFELAGTDDQGRGITERADWTATLRETPLGWRVTAIVPDPLEAVTTLARPFVDVSASLGVGLFRDSQAAAAVTAQADGRRLETVGGLAVVDLNDDGFSDLVAWNRRRLMHVFENDGAGGFQRRSGLLAPHLIGLAQLRIDLDGDGTHEWISSELVDCRDDKGWFNIYQMKAGVLAPVGRLEFAMACIYPGRVMYQQISAVDVDADGRLDLVVAGFGGQLATGSNINKFHSEAGIRNLLFMNRGDLQFTEEGPQRGLNATRFTYALTAFDADDDGDVDLYMANDFAPNTLLINDGAGRFTTAREGPLIANGQSMGVTVADLDGDLTLDVYVSNMYSKAGQRIVPLVKNRLAPDTWATLGAVAGGNTLYAREGGQWVEKAAELGLEKAGWAWGQAAFDADNDGDRDLYVLNGMTSHSKVKDDF